jgi:hypothetical protein
MFVVTLAIAAQSDSSVEYGLGERLQSVALD